MGEPVEVVLFDIDGTLCEYRRSGNELLDLAFEREGVDPFFEVGAYYDRFDAFAARHDSLVGLREACFAAIAENNGRDPDLGRALAKQYAEARNHSEVRALPGAYGAVETLGRDHALGVVTNGGPDTQTPKLEALDLIDAFETVIHAGYDVAPKPDPEPFERALDDIGSRPERAIHVGNSLQADIAGARAAGLRSVWIPDDIGGSDARSESRTGEKRADFTIGSLEELRPSLWG